ncbi:L,D-transpeptidase family protein [Nitrincola sp. MINF-07-Sa-05]|uniref:L,D-transpeptidase family protein n=1 Tax=Nitrincola salilacus TaxID=3400273 RepID=UPI003917E5AE
MNRDRGLSRWVVMGLVWLVCTAAQGELLNEIRQVHQADLQHLQSYYQQPDFTPLWFDQQGWPLSARIDELQEAFMAAADHGLYSARYTSPHQTLSTYQDQPALAELYLTDLFVRLAEDLGRGQLNPRDFDRHWLMERPDLSTDLLISALLRGDSPRLLLNILAPKHPHYQRLQDAYRRYRALSLAGNWQSLPEFPTLREGELHEVIPQIRTRLLSEGDLISDLNSLAALENPLFDAELATAVRHFQQRHGLKADGVIGRDTRAMLNRSPAQTASEIRASLERWRWLPRSMGERYILVNIAGYELELYEGGEVSLHQKVISGQKRRATPSFISDLTYLIIHPNWTVPRRLAVEDMLPDQRADPDFLASKQISVALYEEGQWVAQDPYEIDWTQYGRNNFPFRLRQSPGPHNSLGQIRFGMDNPYSIYLHDTPARNLFGFPLRAFSSGCIRVEGIEELSQRLFNAAGSSVSITEELARPGTRRVALPESLPVYLAYLPVWVDEAGILQIRPDIYGTNEPLISRLDRDFNLIYPQVAAQ